MNVQTGDNLGLVMGAGLGASQARAAAWCDEAEEVGIGITV